MIRQFDFINGPETDTLPSHGIIDPVYSVTKSTSYAVTDTDGYSVIYCTATLTITLPQAAYNTDRRILIINTGSGVVTIDGYGAELINGTANYTLTNQYESVWLESNSTKWFTISIASASATSALIQDYTTISSVGTASQQASGHIPAHANGGYNDLNTTWAEVLAYYKFANGALTTDEKGTYTLTNTGTVINANGIMGTAFGSEFNGSSNYYTEPTLLDTTPTAIAIDFWFNADDGQPAGSQYLFRKNNDETGGSTDNIQLYIKTDGKLSLDIAQNGNTYSITSSSFLPNGATGWYYICACWDVTYGIRLFLNGNLENINLTPTTLMASGSTRDFIIGANNNTGSIANYFDGKICNFRIRDKVITQTDVDIAYASIYANTLGTNQDFKAFIQKGGDTDLIQNYDFSNRVVGLDSSYIYRAGGAITGLGSTDKLKIYGRV